MGNKLLPTLKRKDFVYFFLVLENCAKYCLVPELEPKLEPEPKPFPNSEPEPPTNHYGSTTLLTGDQDIR